MNSLFQSKKVLRVAAAAAAVGCTSIAAVAQNTPTFGVTWRSTSLCDPDGCTAVPILEGDLLGSNSGSVQFGPLAAPCLQIPALLPGLGLAVSAGCAGPPDSATHMVEVDAFSHGLDLAQPAGASLPGIWQFSVDEFAQGRVIPAGALAIPNVRTEGALGALEAASDVFVTSNALPAAPLAPVGGNGGNRCVGAIDGDGLTSTSGHLYRGLGLFEYDASDPSADDVDSLDSHDGVVAVPGAAFFSLEGSVLDPLRGAMGSGSAAWAGFTGADVLRTAPGGAPGLYAAALALGLDRQGVGTDDLDGLILWENGIGGFQASNVAYGWIQAQGNPNPSDMLLFSVRRGSAVVGQLDSFFGVAIEPGDILMPPVAVNSAGGAGNGNPALFIAAERLGLLTNRTDGVNYGDEVDGLDLAVAPILDCNGNGIEDASDIAGGVSLDADLNGIPDECCAAPIIFGTPKVNSAGCSPTIDWRGTPSAPATGGFVITCSDLVNQAVGQLVYSVAGPAAVPFSGGFLYTAVPRRRTITQNSGGSALPALDCTGTMSLDFSAYSQGLLGGMPSPLLTVPGTTVWAQWLVRDPGFVLPIQKWQLSDAIEFEICN